MSLGWIERNHLQGMSGYVRFPQRGIVCFTSEGSALAGAKSGVSVGMSSGCFVRFPDGVDSGFLRFRPRRQGKTVKIDRKSESRAAVVMCPVSQAMVAEKEEMNAVMTDLERQLCMDQEMERIERDCYMLGYNGQSSPICYGFDAYISCRSEAEKLNCVLAIALHHLKEAGYKVNPLPKVLSILACYVVQMIHQYMKGKLDAIEGREAQCASSKTRGTPDIFLQGHVNKGEKNMDGSREGASTSCPIKNGQYLLVGLDVDAMMLELQDEMRKAQTLLRTLFAGYFDFEELDQMDLIADRLDVPGPARRRQAVLALAEGYNDAHALLELLEDVVEAMDHRTQHIQEIVGNACAVEWSIVGASD